MSPLTFFSLPGFNQDFGFDRTTERAWMLLFFFNIDNRQLSSLGKKFFFSYNLLSFGFVIVLSHIKPQWNCLIVSSHSWHVKFPYYNLNRFNNKSGKVTIDAKMAVTVLKAVRGHYKVLQEFKKILVAAKMGESIVSNVIKMEKSIKTNGLLIITTIKW